MGVLRSSGVAVRTIRLCFCMGRGWMPRCTGRRCGTGSLCSTRGSPRFPWSGLRRHVGAEQLGRIRALDRGRARCQRHQEGIDRGELLWRLARGPVGVAVTAAMPRTYPRRRRPPPKMPAVVHSVVTRWPLRQAMEGMLRRGAYGSAILRCRRRHDVTCPPAWTQLRAVAPTPRPVVMAPRLTG